MKKLVMTALVLLTSVSFAATTGQINLSGTVNEELDINVVQTADAANLNILLGETDKKVADVTETSNSLTGYSIKMSSANGSKLVHGIDNTKFTSYTLKYDGIATPALSTTPVEVKNSGALSGRTVDTSLVSISFLGNANAPQGTYTDTVTVSISKN